MNNSSSNLYAGILALAVVVAPNAGPSDCAMVDDQYTAAVAKVVETLRAYGRCVAQSDKKDECAAQIQALDDAHDNFADAIADAKDCK